MKMATKLNRRIFFSNAVAATKKPFQEKEKCIEFQCIKAILSLTNKEDNPIIFYEKFDLSLSNITSLNTVSFLKWPAKKTDIFFQGLLDSEKLTPVHTYAITTKIPKASLKTWDKLVWVSETIPENIPKIPCPVLIIQDIADFDPNHSPADLLGNLPDGSDVFIAQHLDLSDKNNPATKRVYDFLDL
jgi:hypothetical protein